MRDRRSGDRVLGRSDVAAGASRAIELANAGKLREALRHFEAAVRLKPDGSTATSA
jgi:hypothetical protein